MRRALSLFILGDFMLFAAASAAAGGTGVFNQAGIEHREGRYVTSDVSLRDEQGGTVRFGELLGGPAVLVLTYYRCTHICTEMVHAVSDVADKISLRPGRDYSIITLSFDGIDTPSAARQLKADYQKRGGLPFPLVPLAVVILTLIIIFTFSDVRFRAG